MGAGSQGNNETQPSVPYLMFLYLEEMRVRRRVVPDAQYKYEIKYFLTDELVHTNYGHARQFTQQEIGNMQDSVIYKKRLKLKIAKIRKEQEAKNNSKN